MISFCIILPATKLQCLIHSGLYCEAKLLRTEPLLGLLGSPGLFSWTWKVTYTFKLPHLSFLSMKIIMGKLPRCSQNQSKIITVPPFQFEVETGIILRDILSHIVLSYNMKGKLKVRSWKKPKMLSSASCLKAGYYYLTSTPTSSIYPSLEPFSFF